MRLSWSLEALETSFASVCLIVIGGIMLGFFFSYIRTFAARHNPLGANLINYGTIPGVMHHELSHALLAFLTMTKIREIKLFQFHSKDGSLGHVAYVPSKNIVARSIQQVLVSVAPILCGFVSCSLLWYNVRPMTEGNILASIAFYYILVCIILHMSLSKQDVMVMKGGLFVVVLLMTVGFYLAQVDLVTPLMEMVK